MENLSKELRIGNYVHRQSGKMVVNRDDVYKVENINLQSANKYEPISITKEWLQKLGFEGHGSELKKGIFTYLVQQRFFVVAGYEYDYNGINCHPEYVHELQNLYFALTGEELSIK